MLWIQVVLVLPTSAALKSTSAPAVGVPAAPSKLSFMGIGTLEVALALSRLRSLLAPKVPTEVNVKVPDTVAVPSLTS